MFRDIVPHAWCGIGTTIRLSHRLKNRLATEGVWDRETGRFVRGMTDV